MAKDMNSNNIYKFFTGYCNIIKIMTSSLPIFAIP